MCIVYSGDPVALALAYAISGGGGGVLWGGGGVSYGVGEETHPPQCGTERNLINTRAHTEGALSSQPDTHAHNQAARGN